MSETVAQTKRKLGTTLRDAWHLILPYFRSKPGRVGLMLLVGVLVLNLSMVGISVLLNFWRGQMYDSLQHKDAALFWRLMLLWRDDESGFMPGFAGVATVYIFIGVYAQYLQQLFQIRWRAWLTEHTVQDWMSDRAYYTIALRASEEAGKGNPGLDNPDQRISDDLNKFTDYTITYGINLVSTTASLVSFSQILWSLSGADTILGLHVPGYLLYLALFYAVAGTLVANWVGRPLVGLEFARQRAEANFRFGLVRVRENAEGIALYRGDGAETSNLLRRFGAVVANWDRLIRRKKRLGFFSSSYAQAAVVFPFLIASPRYFSGAIELGGLMRVVGAFSEVQVASSWFIDNYSTFAEWRATVDRLGTFQRALMQARREGAGMRVETGAPGAVTVQDATLALPDGRTLLDHVSMTMPAGRSVLVTGRSGAGKSTLFRALAGLWPFGTGRVARPPGSAMFLPQRAYVPLGTLREAVTYPALPGSVPDGDVRQALQDVGLGALTPELDRDDAWGQRLSGGEQQRLAVARALLARPDWLFLDEATASLDLQAEAELYALIRRRLPGTTVVSIAHRPEVARWHDATVMLADGALSEPAAAVAAK